MTSIFFAIQGIKHFATHLIDCDICGLLIWKVACLGIAADKLTLRVKLQCFKKITDQDAAFFDRQENTVGDLVLYLVDDPGNVNQVSHCYQEKELT